MCIVAVVVAIRTVAAKPCQYRVVFVCVVQKYVHYLFDALVGFFHIKIKNTATMANASIINITTFVKGLLHWLFW